MNLSRSEREKWLGAGEIGMSFLNPVEAELLEKGSQLRDNLGFGNEANIPEQDEAILDEVERQFPGFNRAMNKWARWFSALMFSGGDG